MKNLFIKVFKGTVVPVEYKNPEVKEVQELIKTEVVK